MSTLAEKFWIVLALFLGTAPFALFGASADELETTRSQRLMLWAVVYIGFAGLAVVHRGTITLLFRDGRLLLALTALTTLSAIWSLSPVTTLSASAALWASTFIAAYMALRISPRELLNLLTIALGTLAAGSMLVILLLPDYGVMTGTHEGLWNGLTTHKNALGRYMVMGVVIAADLALKPQNPWRLLLLAVCALCFILMLGTQSATAYVLLVAFMFLYALLRTSANLAAPARTGLLLIGLSIIAIAALLLTDATVLEETLTALGRDTSLTHRTRIWAGAMDAISEQPWLGYGYEAFWGSSTGTSFSLHYTSWNVPHVHNGFLEVWLGLGVTGVILLTALTLSFLRHITSRMSPDLLMLFALTLTTSLVLNLVEFNFLRYNNIFWILFIYVLLRLKAELRTA